MLLFYNAKSNSGDMYVVHDPVATEIVVIRKGNGTHSGLDELNEGYLYSGEENNLRYIRTYSLNFRCYFDMRNYPFDTQECFIIMNAADSRRHMVNLLAESVSWHNNTRKWLTIPQYNIGRTRMWDEAGNITVSIMLQRNPAFILFRYD